MLSMYVSKNQRNWDQHLDHVLFAYRTSWHETIKESPFYMMYGRNPILPIDTELDTNQSELEVDTLTYKKRLKQNLKLAYNISHYHTLKEQEKQRRNYDKKRSTNNYEIGDQVWVFTPRVKEGLSKKLATLWHGPYRIEEKYSNVNYKISRRDNETMKQRIHITRLKPYYSFHLRPKIIPELEKDDDFDIDEEYNDAIIDDPWIPDESMQRELEKLDPKPIQNSIEAKKPEKTDKKLRMEETEIKQISRPTESHMLKSNFETIDKAIANAPIIEVSEEDLIQRTASGATRGIANGFGPLIEMISAFRDVLVQKKDKAVPVVQKALIRVMASKGDNTYISNDSRKAEFKRQIIEASDSYERLYMLLSHLTEYFDYTFKKEIDKRESKKWNKKPPQGVSSKGKGVCNGAGLN
jgi:hypothetical protein